MKKLNFVIFGALLAISLTTQALAETTIPWTKEGCESVKGTWITAHSATDEGCDTAHCNGRNFCAYGGTKTMNMNWWSALIWCQSIGRELTDIETACPNGIASSSSCANLKGETRLYWTSTPSPTNAGRSVIVQDGNILDNAYAVRTNAQAIKHALCK